MKEKSFKESPTRGTKSETDRKRENGLGNEFADMPEDESSDEQGSDSEAAHEYEDYDTDTYEFASKDTVSDDTADIGEDPDQPVLQDR